MSEATHRLRGTLILRFDYPTDPTAYPDSDPDAMVLFDMDIDPMAFLGELTVGEPVITAELVEEDA
jgi:hypothetical protein